MENKDKTPLEELKEKYFELQKKYSLPEFDGMNKDFGIEKAAEFEGELLIREIRRFIGDRIANYMRLVENLINPVNVPIFVFSMVKVLDEEDKKALSEIYKKLGELEISLVGIDLDFSEEKEAKFIKESFEVWQIIKKDLVKIIEKVKSSKDSKPKKNDKNYFG
jgi:hypothetical protein